AADRKHEASCAIAPVGAQGHDARHVEGAYYFAGCTQFDAVAQANPHEGVMNEAQAFAQRCADMVDELDWGGAGAAFGSVDNDEVGRDARFKHGLCDGEPFPWVADAQFEADGLSA